MVWMLFFILPSSCNGVAAICAGLGPVRSIAVVGVTVRPSFSVAAAALTRAPRLRCPSLLSCAAVQPAECAQDSGQLAGLGGAGQRTHLPRHSGRRAAAADTHRPGACGCASGVEGGEGGWWGRGQNSRRVAPLGCLAVQLDLKPRRSSFHLHPPRPAVWRRVVPHPPPECTRVGGVCGTGSHHAGPARSPAAGALWQVSWRRRGGVRGQGLLAASCRASAAASLPLLWSCCSGCGFTASPPTAAVWPKAQLLLPAPLPPLLPENGCWGPLCCLLL